MTAPAPPHADTNVLLVIGEDETPISISKTRLMTIPFFDRMFSSPFPFRESIENKVTLPEDDAGLWRRAEEYLRSGDFHPRFKASEPGDTRPARRLEGPLLVEDDEGKMVAWVDSSIDRFGTEFLSGGTREMLEDILSLLQMAEKYCWADLMDECVFKIAAFPIGWREYAMISKHCYQLRALPYVRRTVDEAVPVGMIGFLPREDFPAGKGDVAASKRKLAWVLDHIGQSIALATRMREELW